MGLASSTRRADFLRYDRTLGVAAMEGRGFYYPVDVAIRADGRLYGLSRSHEGDPRGVRVCILDRDSRFYGVFGSVGEEDGQFVHATAIALDSAGHAYVSDEHTQRISVFGPSGDFLYKWGTPGAASGQINGPCGLAFDAQDNLYVTDHLNSRVQKFTREGGHLMSFGTRGDGDGEFNLPWGLTVAPDGDVYVADWRNDRVQRFSPDGVFAASYGGSGHTDGRFHRPSSVAVDREGYIYVADWGNERVQVLDPGGEFVLKLRGEATLSKWAEEFLLANVDEAGARSRSDLEPDLDIQEPHRLSSHVEKLFWSPISVKLDSDGRLYVTDRNRHRIQVFEAVGADDSGAL